MGSTCIVTCCCRSAGHIQTCAGRTEAVCVVIIAEPMSLCVLKGGEGRGCVLGRVTYHIKAFEPHLLKGQRSSARALTHTEAMVRVQSRIIIDKDHTAWLASTHLQLDYLQLARLSTLLRCGDSLH